MFVFLDLSYLTWDEAFFPCVYPFAFKFHDVIFKHLSNTPLFKCTTFSGFILQLILAVWQV